MSTDTALPTAPEATASGQQTTADQLAQDHATDGDGGQAAGDGQTEGDKPTKAEKTEEQRRIEKLERAIDRRTRRASEAIGARDAQIAQMNEELQRLRAGGTPTDNSNKPDDEPVTLSRAELQKMVKAEAERLAPTLKQQQAEIEHRTQVIEGLAKDLGQERFDALAEDLDEALGGLQRNGRATPATEAIFAADDPKAVIQYLADPEHADEAEAIGRMDPIRAGRAIAKLEAKLERAKADSKPQRSKADPPVEPARGGGGAVNDQPDPSNVKAWIAWANKQDRAA